MKTSLRTNWMLPVMVTLALGAAAPGLAGCGGGSQQACTGKERCACYANATCNLGLECLSNLCVVPGGGTAGVGAGTGGVASVGGASGSTGGTLGGTGAVGGGATGGLSGAAGATASGGTIGVGGGPAIGTGGGASAGATGTGGAMASGGATGAGGGLPTGTGGSNNPDGGTCRVFETVAGGGNAIPTVFLLVDRSGSMFTCADMPMSSTTCADQTKTIWAVLRAGMLQVVQQLQGQVRFGFGAFTGDATKAVCPIFDSVPTALDNYTPIAAVYSPLGALGVKAETPVGAALDKAKTTLAADTSPGPKYILFVTDGQPDFCNDGNTICASDSVVAHLQALKAGGITTLIFGIQNGGATSVPLPSLQAFANAGAGQPVLGLTDPATFTADQCTIEPAWNAEVAAAGRPARTPLGAYVASGAGTATVYKPDPSNQATLGDLLLGTVAAVKSCTFDLANGLSVDLAKVDQASVVIEGMSIPGDATNGWSMSSKTQLKLSGNACALWRQPSTRNIDFQFPCGTVVGG